MFSDVVFLSCPWALITSNFSCFVIKAIVLDWIFLSFKVLRDASYYGCWIQGTMDELPLREQGRSPLKYTNCVVCVCLERKVCLLRRVWVSIKSMDKLFSTRQTFGAKTPKKSALMLEAIKWKAFVLH
jgi:hypothetical protein